MQRCPWAAQEAMQAYHDHEWGVPVHDDRLLFEMLTLEGAQAGLSWSTILHKREGYRRLFEDFAIEKVAALGPADVNRLLADPAIVRHRGKIEATITNARAALRVIERHGSFDACLWQFVNGQTVQNRWRWMEQVPARTAASDAMSRQLKRDGFKFVGSTICYAFMQAVGMVNNHTTDCFRHAALCRVR